jgi:N-acetylneuraminate synthase/N,N'-diacetyllegionaminate synthase
MSKIVDIEGRKIGPGNPCFIVGEIGINHNGDPQRAMEMIDAIADAGADCVKFQTFRAEEFLVDEDLTYTYFSQGKEVTESQMDMFQRCEFDWSEFKDLFAHVRERGLIPLSTPTDRDAVDFLDGAGVGAFKVGSDDIVYTPFLSYMAKKGKPVIISSGMADAEDIKRAVKTIEETGNDQIIVCHCVSEYPAPEEHVNLRKISEMRKFIKHPVGYSDHSQGLTAAMGAVALGACYFERHFTLDKELPGPDHWFAADPGDMKNLVTGIRQIEKNLGAGALCASDNEEKMKPLMRRSIVAALDLEAGHIITEEDLAYQRPGNGLMPYAADRIIGRRVLRDIAAGTVLAMDMLEKETRQP